MINCMSKFCVIRCNEHVCLHFLETRGWVNPISISILRTRTCTYLRVKSISLMKTMKHFIAQVQVTVVVHAKLCTSQKRVSTDKLA